MRLIPYRCKWTEVLQHFHITRVLIDFDTSRPGKGQMVILLSNYLQITYPPFLAPFIFCFIDCLTLLNGDVTACWLSVVPLRRGQRSGCDYTFYSEVCLMQQGGDVCLGWIRLNILPHNSHPRCTNTEWDKSSNCTTMRRKLRNPWSNKQTLLLPATLPSFPSSFMQQKNTVQKGIKVVVQTLFEGSNKSKHNSSDQRGSNRTQPLTSGIFIVSGEQLNVFLGAILNTFY